MRTLFLYLAIAMATPARGGVVTDGSLGPKGAVGKLGNDYQIRSQLGKRVGSNLFHSFETFRLSQGESATFSGPNRIHHILARVTGDRKSLIDGTLRSTIPGASLFLMNPNGVVFGANAEVDIPGSVAITSADYLKLRDGGRFAADFSADSLTSAPVRAFGFLRAKPASIRSDGPTIAGQEGRALSLIGGNLSLDRSQILASDGSLTLFSAASSGEVPASQRSLRQIPKAAFDRLGRIRLRNSVVSASGSGEGKGKLMIRGGKLQLEDSSFIINNQSGDGPGGTLDINVRGTLNLANGQVQSNNDGSASGADMHIQAGRLRIDATTGIASAVASIATEGSTGSGGDVNVRASDLTITGGGKIFSNALGTGRGGMIRVSANELFIDDLGAGLQTGINSSAGAGEGGAISLQTRRLSILNGGSISSPSFRAPANSININTSILLIDAGGTDLNTGIFSNSFDASQGAKIAIQADGIGIFRGGLISTLALGSGRAGDILINCGLLVVDEADTEATGGIIANTQNQSIGRGGDLLITAQNIEMRGSGLIATNTAAPGNAGDVHIEVKHLSLDGENTGRECGISATVLTSGSGAGGDIRIRGRSAIIQGGASVATTVSGRGPGGNVDVKLDELTIDAMDSSKPCGIFAVAKTGATAEAGNLLLKSNNILVTNGGQIAASTVGDANAGNVSIQAGNLRLDHNGVDAQTGIFAIVGSEANGNGGKIVVRSDLLQILSGSQISTTTFGLGSAGGIEVHAGHLSLFRQNSRLVNSISSNVNSGATGSGGMVEVFANSLSIHGGSEISASTFGQGDGGSLSISADRIVLSRDGSRFFNGIFGNVDLFATGEGGDIQVVSSNLRVLGGSEISAVLFGKGAAGNLRVSTGTMLLDGQKSSEPNGIFAAVAEGGIGASGSIRVRSDNLKIFQESQISSTTFGLGDGGNVEVHADTLLADRLDEHRSSIATGIFAGVGESGIGDGGDVTVHAQDLTLRRGGSLSVTSSGRGKGGSIRVNTGSLQIDAVDAVNFGTGIFADLNAGAEGSGGDIAIDAAEIRIANGGEIRADTNGKGDSGDVDITTDRLTLNRNGAKPENSISANVIAGAVGNGGDVDIESDFLAIRGGSAISAATFGRGDAGSLSVSADRIVLSGENSPFPNGIFGNVQVSGIGHGGDVRVEASNLQILSGSEISAVLSGTGEAGNLRVSAGTLVLDRENSVSANGIFATVNREGTGRSGDIRVRSEDLKIFQGSQVSSSTFGVGDGGSVDVRADALRIDGAGLDTSVGILAVVAEGAIGEGGDVFVRAGSLLLKNNGVISADTLGHGNGGTVQVEAGLLRISDDLPDDFSGIFANSQSNFGNGGSILIDADKIVLNGEKSAVHAVASKGRPAGSLRINANSMEVFGGSIGTFADKSNAGTVEIRVTTELALHAGSEISAAAAANGGNVFVNTGNLFYLDHSKLLATAGQNGLAGAGGNIVVSHPEFIVLNNGRISANAALGKGGNILLDGEFFFSSSSSITATGTTSGTIQISAPDLDLSNALTPFSFSFVDDTLTFQERCAMLLKGDFSSFLVVGRGGVSGTPEDTRVETGDSAWQVSPVRPITPEFPR